MHLWRASGWAVPCRRSIHKLGQDPARASPLGLGLGGSPKKIQHPDSASLQRNWVKVCLLLQQKSVLSNGCLEALWYAASLSHYKGSWDFKAMSVSTHRERLYHKQDCFFFFFKHHWCSDFCLESSCLLISWPYPAQVEGMSKTWASICLFSMPFLPSISNLLHLQCF